MDVNIILLIVVVLIVLSLGSLNYMENTENFQGNDGTFDMEINLENLAKALSSHGTVEESSANSNTLGYRDDNNDGLADALQNGPADVVARAWCKQRCPVDMDSDRNDWIKKSQIAEDTCPPMPDLSDYVLKSSIPPVQKCPPCICPKVQVQAGLCKATDNDTANDCGPCPPPERCDQSICPECKYYGVLTVTDIDKAIDEMGADLTNKKNVTQLHNILNKIATKLKNPHSHHGDLHKLVKGTTGDEQGLDGEHEHVDPFVNKSVKTEQFLETDEEDYNDN